MLTDSHCHLDFSVFDEARDQLILACQNKGITHFINPAVAFSNWHRLVKLQTQYDCISIGFDLHPCFVKEHKDIHLEQLDHWTQRHHSSFIGEIGLDKRDKNHFEAQMLFLMHNLRCKIT